MEQGAMVAAGGTWCLRRSVRRLSGISKERHECMGNIYDGIIILHRLHMDSSPSAFFHIPTIVMGRECQSLLL